MSDSNQTIEDLKINVAVLISSDLLNKATISTCVSAIEDLKDNIKILQDEINFLKGK